MDDTTDSPRAAPPTLVGFGSLLLGGLFVFAALVGYGLADGKYSGWSVSARASRSASRRPWSASPAWPSWSSA